MYNTSFVVIVWCRKAPVNVSNVNAGSVRSTPRPATNGTKKPKGLKWEYQCAAANPAGASRLQTLRPVRRVAELGSLIWLEYVKQVVALLSEIFHFHSGLRHRGLSESETGTLDCGYQC